MNDELEKLIEDRNNSENEMIRLEEELADLERSLGADYEDSEEWNSLNDECNELNNWVSYLNACISSIQGGYEE